MRGISPILIGCTMLAILYLIWVINISFIVGIWISGIHFGMLFIWFYEDFKNDTI